VRRVLVALVAITQLIGCAHVRSASPTPFECTFEDVNRALQGQDVHVELSGSRELYAGNVRVAPRETTLTLLFRKDSQGWVPLSTAGRDTTLRSSEIQTLTITGLRRGSTAARGFRNGFLVGAAAGALLGLTTYEPGLMMPSSSLGFAAILGGIGGVVFGAAGFVLGAIAGTDEVYDLSKRASDGSVIPRRV
jgi:hypothetical protein